MRVGAILAGVAVVVAGDEETGCTITAKECKNYPEFRRTTFRDSVGESHLGAAENDAACLKRAEDFHHWCGNSKNSASVAASYNPTQWSQVFVPGACEPGWSQFDTSCYKHYWEKKTWWEAEALCTQRGAHLCSIHAKAENRFIYQLTSGLTAWIGYSDIDQDKEYEWTDNTQNDFSNMAKNCTGREEEPDCKPEERKQQWYDWDGADRGTFICKRDALLPIALLNVSVQDLVHTPWTSLMPRLAAAGGVDLGSGAAASVARPTLPVLNKNTTPSVAVFKKVWLSDLAPEIETSSNNAKNCTECMLDGKTLQWYDQKNATESLLKNVTVQDIINKPWDSLLPAFGEANATTSLSWLSEAAAEILAPEPLLVMPSDLFSWM